MAGEGVELLLGMTAYSHWPCMVTLLALEPGPAEPQSVRNNAECTKSVSLFMKDLPFL
jgi:hypothetical protein